jgi:hypothetical protein
VLTENDEEIQRLKNYLANQFEIKDLGNLNILWGLNKLDRDMVSSSPSENMFLIYSKRHRCSVVRLLTIW